MGVSGTKVAVVGGSIAGCAAAITLDRAGADVTILERSQHALRDRGAGIVLPVGLLGELCSTGYLDEDLPVCPCRERVWVCCDRSAPEGRVMWRQPFAAVLNSWAVLWRALRSRVPDSDYHGGAVVSAVSAGADGVIVATPDGRQRFDAVIGADGHNSVVCTALNHDASTADAGYVLWRGAVAADTVSDDGVVRLLRDTLVTLCFARGHAIVYLVPDPRGAAVPLVNWALYTRRPPSLDPRVHQFVAPGSMSAELVDWLHRHARVRLPAAWGDLVTATSSEHIALQPVHDRVPAAYARKRLLLMGDAAAVSRPHTGSGAVKALQDALTLRRLVREESSWPAIAIRYEAERRTVGDDLVQLGRRLGLLLVEQTPDWGAMKSSGVETAIASLQSASRFWAYGTEKSAR